MNLWLESNAKKLFLSMQIATKDKVNTGIMPLQVRGYDFNRRAWKLVDGSDAIPFKWNQDSQRIITSSRKLTKSD